MYNNSVLPGPWDPGFKTIIPDSDGPDTYLFACGNFNCVTPDVDGDVIIGRITFQCESTGDTVITISPIPIPGFDTIARCSLPTVVYDSAITPNALTIHQIDDIDGDAIPNADDNCPTVFNPSQEDGAGELCSMNQEDTYPTGGNDCGDACECEGNFDDDTDQDGTDAAAFKTDFGRGNLSNPCPMCPTDPWCVFP